MSDLWKIVNENSGGIGLVVGGIGGVAGFFAWIRSLQSRAKSAENRAETSEGELKTERENLPLKIAEATRELRTALEAAKGDKFSRLQTELVDKQKRREASRVALEREELDVAKEAKELDEAEAIHVARAGLECAHRGKEASDSSRAARRSELENQNLGKRRKLEDRLRWARTDLAGFDKEIEIMKAEIERCRPNPSP